MERHYGKIRGFIYDRDDPKKLKRCKVTVPELMGDAVSDWAWPDFGHGEDSPAAPQVGIGVWVEFERGLLDRPIYGGRWNFEPDGESSIPNIAKGKDDGSVMGRNDVAVSHAQIPEPPAEPDETDFSRIAEDAVAKGQIVVTEPGTKETGEYPDMDVKKSTGGHTDIQDERPGQQRRMYQHPAGSYRDYGSDGGVTDKTVGRRHEITIGNSIRHIVGRVIDVFEKNVVQTFWGNLDQYVNRDMKLRVKRDMQIDAKNLIENYGDVETKVEGLLKQKILGQMETFVAGGLSETIAGGQQKIVMETIKETIMNTSAFGMMAKKIVSLVGGFGVTAAVPGPNGYAIVIGDETGALTADVLPVPEIPIPTTGNIHFGTALGFVELISLSFAASLHVGSPLGSLMVDAIGITLTAPQVNMGPFPPYFGVLTEATLDQITGLPYIGLGSLTVKGSL